MECMSDMEVSRISVGSQGECLVCCHWCTTTAEYITQLGTRTQVRSVHALTNDTSLVYEQSKEKKVIISKKTVTALRVRFKASWTLTNLLQVNVLSVVIKAIMATHLSNFSALSTSVSLYTPPDYETGNLIILCTWMGAADKHIAKYTDFHRAHFPTCKILLLRCTVPSLLLPYSAQRNQLKAAVHTIRAVIAECGIQSQGSAAGEAPHILLHLFSSGGANTATQLLLALHQDLQAPVPLVGIVCDSAPAGASYWNGYTAFTEALPKGYPAGLLSSLIVHIILCLLYLNIALGRYEHPEELYRKTLLDDRLWVNSKGAKRRIAYVASEADRLTKFEDVRAHAGKARRAGLEVTELCYLDTRHVNHLAKDPEAYLSFIMAVCDGLGDMSD